MDGIYLVDKPAGITSFDVIRKLRKQMNIQKMGHAGTLDPFASGLMLIGIGKGTKELTKLIKLDKVYTARVVFGIQTNTGDRTGKVLISSESHIQPEKISEALSHMIGEHMYIPPSFSAIKIGGKKLYEYARAGTDIDIPARKMIVYNTKLIAVEYDSKYTYADISFSVASGTYIRTLAEELGKLLGVPASLVELRRESIGSYTVRDAQQLSV